MKFSFRLISIGFLLWILFFVLSIIPNPKPLLPSTLLSNYTTTTHYKFILIYVTHLKLDSNKLQERTLKLICEVYKFTSLVILVDNQSPNKNYFKEVLKWKSCTNLVVLTNPTDSFELGATKVALDYLRNQKIAGNYYWILQHTMELMKPLPEDRLKGFTNFLYFSPLFYSAFEEEVWITQLAYAHSLNLNSQNAGIFGPSWILTHDVMLKFVDSGVLDWGIPNSKIHEQATERLLGLVSEALGFHPTENSLDGDFWEYDFTYTYETMKSKNHYIRKIYGTELHLE